MEERLEFIISLMILIVKHLHIERFNRNYREDVLDAYMFESLQHLRELSSEWQDEYNEFHPHQS